GLMVIGLARLLSPRPATLPAEAAEGTGGGPYREAEDAAEGAVSEAFFVRISLLLWTAFGYGALMLYTARYGETTFHSVAPVAVAIAMLLRDLVRSKGSWWGEAVVAGLFTVLILRDYALFPGTAVDSLPLLDLTLPEVFNPRSAWGTVVVLFLGALALTFAAGEGFAKKPDFRAPYAFIGRQWGAKVEGVAPLKLAAVIGGCILAGAAAAFAGNGGLVAGVLLAPVVAVGAVVYLTRPRLSAGAGWLTFTLFLGALLMTFGLACVIAKGQLQLASIALRAGKRIVVLLVALPIALVAGQLALWLGAKLGAFRVAPILLAGVVFGAYTSFGYLPALSAHFSPRPVYDAFNELRADGEPLVEYRVSGRAAAYYAEGDEVREIESQSELISYLSGDERTWAVIPADQLPTLNRAFRARNRRHLFVADAENARLLLVSGREVEGAENASFIAEAVLDEAPTPQHPVGANFNDKIELIGYDLELPQEGFAGAGQDFTIVWYWRALSRTPGSYKIFLHVDGAGNRLNGDHDPVDGRYPVRLWDQGDVVVDRQELTVPANYRPGQYTIWLGFFSGSTRLEVKEVANGSKDNVNRVNAGTLLIR
ncbi:MAG: hypothetical protein AAF645_27375, partial [Myxococcota bacterium]